MSSSKLRAKLMSQRPDLCGLDQPAELSSDLPLDMTGEVDDRDLSLAAWDKADLAMSTKKEILSDDAIREMFSQRPLSPVDEDPSAPSIGIVRALKKSRFTFDTHEESKDFIVDENEGLLGSQG